MKKLIGILVLILISGCAHQTVHQYCNAHNDAYLDYNQCYSEVSQSGIPLNTGSKILRVIGAAAGGFGSGLNASRANQTNCVTSGDHGYYRTSCR